MYRVVCDHEGCTASPQEDSDYYAWSDVTGAEETAVESGWRVADGKHWCVQHYPPACGYCDAFNVPLTHYSAEFDERYCDPCWTQDDDSVLI